MSRNNSSPAEHKKKDCHGSPFFSFGVSLTEG